MFQFEYIIMLKKLDQNSTRDLQLKLSEIKRM
jgi:hypothetical protein